MALLLAFYLIPTAYGSWNSFCVFGLGNACQPKEIPVNQPYPVRVKEKSTLDQVRDAVEHQRWWEVHQLQEEHGSRVDTLLEDLLFENAKKGNYQVVQKLVEDFNVFVDSEGTFHPHDANPSWTSCRPKVGKRTALFAAVLTDHVQIAKYLKKMGGTMDWLAKDEGQKDLLLFQCSQGSQDSASKELFRFWEGQLHRNFLETIHDPWTWVSIGCGAVLASVFLVLERVLRGEKLADIPDPMEFQNEADDLPRMFHEGARQRVAERCKQGGFFFKVVRFGEAAMNIVLIFAVGRLIVQGQYFLLLTFAAFFLVACRDYTPAELLAQPALTFGLRTFSLSRASFALCRTVVLGGLILCVYHLEMLRFLRSSDFDDQWDKFWYFLDQRTLKSLLDKWYLSWLPWSWFPGWVKVRAEDVSAREILLWFCAILVLLALLYVGTLLMVMLIEAIFHLCGWDKAIPSLA